jgi:hypothetical protein
MKTKVRDKRTYARFAIVRALCGHGRERWIRKVSLGGLVKSSTSALTQTGAVCCSSDQGPQTGIAPLAERTNLNRQNLYKALSGQGNPRLNTLGTILHGLEFKLAVQHLRHTDHRINP